MKLHPVTPAAGTSTTSTGWVRALVAMQFFPGEVSNTSILSSPSDRATRWTTISCPPLDRSPDATAIARSRPKSTCGRTPAQSSAQNRD
jgi:hypothetical protein